MAIDTDALETVRPSRRTVVRGAAWSVPVISVAATAPAFAASPCDPVSLTNFPMNGGTVGTASNGTYVWSKTLTTGSSSVTLSATSQYANNMARAADQGGYAHFSTTANAGGTGTPGLQMFQNRTVANVANPGDHTGTYTFTFNRAVSNLTFTLSDIDYYMYTEGIRRPVDYRQYDDRVAVVSSSAFTVESRGANLVSNSAGSLANPFRTNSVGQDAGNIDLDEGAGNAVVKFAGPLKSFSVVYWNGFNDANADTRIQVTLLSNMSFTYAPCS